MRYLLTRLRSLMKTYDAFFRRSIFSVVLSCLACARRTSSSAVFSQKCSDDVATTIARQLSSSLAKWNLMTRSQHPKSSIRRTTEMESNCKVRVYVIVLSTLVYVSGINSVILCAPASSQAPSLSVSDSLLLTSYFSVNSPLSPPLPSTDCLPVKVCFHGLGLLCDSDPIFCANQLCLYIG